MNADSSPTPEPKKNPLIDFVQGLLDRDDRGALAVLRGALSTSEDRQMRAWRLLAPFGGIPEKDAHYAEVVRIIAGLMTLPKLGTKATGKNFGDSCRKLLGDEERKKLHNPEQPGPVSRRMQHLLAASRDEVCDRVCALGRRIGNEEGNIDFGLLLGDLTKWTHGTKANWAAAFWGGEPTSKQDKA